MRNRTRVIQTKGECGGTVCNQLDLKNSEQCTEAINLDCILTEWSAWSNCSTGCGTGLHQRFRSVIQSPKCNGKPCDLSFESKVCISYTSNKDCLVISYALKNLLHEIY